VSGIVRLVVCALLLCLGVPAAQAAPPFEIQWIAGTCVACKTATSLVDVQFVGPQEAWGIGYAPPGETGMGDYAVLHSGDGGRTWREIPEPWQHNESPVVAFADARDGWLKDIDLVAAETRLLWTRDGGAHWRRTAMRDLFVDQMQYLGHGRGYVATFDPYRKQGDLLSTDDNGTHWRQSALPAGFLPGAMTFVDPRHGALAGCVGRRLTVLATADAGAHWRAHGLDLPPAPFKNADDCTVTPDGFGFLDATHGWLLASRRYDVGTIPSNAAAWTTADGGATWQPVFRAGYRFPDEDFGGLTFLDSRRGLLWKQEGRRSKLLYTIDGGRDWQGLAVPRAMTTCERRGGEIDCAGNGFWSVRIVAAKTGP